MFRIVSIVLAVVCLGALAAAGTSSAKPVGTVSGDLGPSSISLVSGGKAVKHLKAGVAYRFAIRDHWRSSTSGLPGRESTAC